MKTISFTLILACSVFYCHGQQGSINIQQDEKIANLLGIYKSVNENSSHYRIQVGFGSFQEAETLKANVDRDFPDWPTKIDFESPSYRVRIGRFKTQLEGERKLIEVRQKYPSAMLLKPEKATN
ncbi:SPOR domain-containing protein [Arenibacter troitsensis]|uniref:Sporulation related domain-containing protein n=1 Tax=Arenibacter troitsensis TaxID=188872 RepID=A0A1X7HY23_9FLAO|nr:SPOR domain-containing protein [Arenibacter troitsensis]SMG06723.1 Sporulation related domain-containing protein [Arenibacter troitsensis]